MRSDHRARRFPPHTAHANCSSLAPVSSCECSAMQRSGSGHRPSMADEWNRLDSRPQSRASPCICLSSAFRSSRLVTQLRGERYPSANSRCHRIACVTCPACGPQGSGGSSSSCSSSSERAVWLARHGAVLCVLLVCCPALDHRVDDQVLGGGGGRGRDTTARAHNLCSSAHDSACTALRCCLSLSAAFSAFRALTQPQPARPTARHIASHLLLPPSRTPCR